jgi:carbon monoxide dehydrogenase subunit G
MASIYKEFFVSATPEFVWEAIKDVGAVHSRLACGFVTSTELLGSTRTVTFANGFVVQEQIVSVSDEHRRLAYRAVGGSASHHNAYFQVLPCAGDTARVLWVTDMLPDEMRSAIEQMVEPGSHAIKNTIEEAYRSQQ